MATTIVTKYGSDAPAASDIVRGELAVDTENGRLYTENSSGAVVEIGLNPEGNVDVTGTVTADGLTVDGAWPILTLNDTRNINTWADGDVVGELKFTTNDTGMTNPIASIRAVHDRAGTGHSSNDAGLEFYTSATTTGTIAKRIEIESVTGDISFYEDTGTTAKFFWDASAESLGIGTASPDTQLTLFKASTNADVNYAKMRMDSWGSSQGRLKSIAWDDSGNPVAAIGAEYDGNKTNIHFHSQYNGGFKGTSDRTMSIMGNGSVGIGTSTATSIQGFAKVLKVEDAGSTSIVVSGDVHEAEYAVSANGGWFGTSTNIPQRFVTNNTERMRLDTSGNLLVGKTSGPNYNTVGIDLTPLGELQVTGDGRVVATFNRKTSDGDIAVFRKDGTTAGSIGTNGGRLSIGSGDVNLNFNASANSIYPISDTAGSLSDGIVDVGASTARFKDLYLSGGAYLGGTGAANKLEDYEEGTWTGTLIGTVSAPSTAITATGRYTKIGRLVTAVIAFSNKDSTGASGNISVTGLPFTALNGGIGAGWHSRSNTGSGTNNGIMSYIGSTNELALVNGLGNAITWASTGTGTYAQFSVTYTT